MMAGGIHTHSRGAGGSHKHHRIRGEGLFFIAWMMTAPDTAKAFAACG